MMRILYNLVILLYTFSIKVAALFGNEKAKLWVKGRRQWFKQLESSLLNFKEADRYWFHCASLGEFEQGRSLIEKVRKEFPDAYILLTFFSPSGYEIRKQYSEVNFVSYLPADTKKNAKKFINILNPKKTFFIKYEFWYHYINELDKRKKPIYIVSAIFRPQQIFFKWYGGFYRKLLKKITHIFLQDKNSSHLLLEKDITNISISGDTRFDRVQKISAEAKSIKKLDEFIGENRSIIAGSTWPEDEELLLKVFYTLEDKNLKLIIVPHEVSATRINSLKSKINDPANSNSVTLYSDSISNLKAPIMIVDTIGILSSAYKYATITYVGGGFDKGIHNILEPAAHGKPIFFGPQYNNFKEAHELISNGSAFCITDTLNGNRLIQKLLKNQSLLETTSKNASDYVNQNIGATDKIFKSVFNQPKKKSPGFQQTIEY